MTGATRAPEHMPDGPYPPDVPGMPAAGTDSLEAHLADHGVTRRSFLRYCSYMAGILVLPKFPFGNAVTGTQAIATALAASQRLPVVWLNGQDCNGNIESFLRATNPTPSQLVLDKLAINYAELLMAPAGSAAEHLREQTVAAGGYVLVCEGAIPTGAAGAYACIGGRAHADIVRQAASRALVTIAIGSCAFDGGLAAAKGGVTGAVGVRQLLGPTAKVVALPGCPTNVENLTATIVHYLTFGAWPARDSRDRPLFAYGSEIHEHCPRREHFEEGQFVRAWGDAGHRKGWCLRYMGCQGPETHANCPTVKWNAKTSWPIGAGSVCIGCVRPRFWDVPGGFYLHRPGDD